MGRAWTPSIVPDGHDDNVYLVVDCFGKHGCVWREAATDGTDLETVITDLMAGQYSDPDKVVAFNVADNRAQDVSSDIAREIRRRADLAHQDLSSSVENFVNRHIAAALGGRRAARDLPRTA